MKTLLRGERGLTAVLWVLGKAVAEGRLIVGADQKLTRVFNARASSSSWLLQHPSRNLP